MRRRPDTDLIVLARKGSVEAAEALFDRYWTFAWRAAFAVTGDRSLADDAAQEAAERAFGALDRFDETQPFAPWFKRIAINRAIDHLRSARRFQACSEEAVPHTWDVGESAEDDLRSWAIADAVAGLSETKRLVVVLHYWLDLPLEEIAGVLGLPVGTVASRLARAKAELRDVLEDDRVV